MPSVLVLGVLVVTPAVSVLMPPSSTLPEASISPLVWGVSVVELAELPPSSPFPSISPLVLGAFVVGLAELPPSGGNVTFDSGLPVEDVSSLSKIENLISQLLSMLLLFWHTMVIQGPIIVFIKICLA